MKVKNYNGEVLDIQRDDSHFRVRINLGEFLPASAKDIRKLLGIIKDTEFDPDTRTRYVRTILDWLQDAIKDLSARIAEAETAAAGYREMGRANKTFDKVAGYRDKEKNYYKNRIERYEKCRDQVIETADKLGIEKGE